MWAGSFVPNNGLLCCLQSCLSFSFSFFILTFFFNGLRSFEICQMRDLHCKCFFFFFGMPPFDVRSLHTLVKVKIRDYCFLLFFFHFFSIFQEIHLHGLKSQATHAHIYFLIQIYELALIDSCQYAFGLQTFTIFLLIVSSWVQTRTSCLS